MGLVVGGEDVVDKKLAYVETILLPNVHEDVASGVTHDLVGLRDVVIFEDRFVVVSDCKLGGCVDFKHVGRSSVINVMTEAGKNQNEFLKFTEVLPKKLMMSKGIAAMHDVDSMHEVVEGVLPFVVLMFENGDEVAKFLLWNLDLPDVRAHLE